MARIGEDAEANFRFGKELCTTIDDPFGQNSPIRTHDPPGDGRRIFYLQFIGLFGFNRKFPFGQRLHAVWVLGLEGEVVVGLSPLPSPIHHTQEYDLPFQLLVDSDHAIAEAYGAWGERSMYGKKYMGVIRSHFVIDDSGKLLDVQYKISPKKSAELALKALN